LIELQGKSLGVPFTTSLPYPLPSSVSAQWLSFLQLYNEHDDLVTELDLGKGFDEFKFDNDGEIGPEELAHRVIEEYEFD